MTKLQEMLKKDREMKEKMELESCCPETNKICGKLGDTITSPHSVNEDAKKESYLETMTRFKKILKQEEIMERSKQLFYTRFLAYISENFDAVNFGQWLASKKRTIEDIEKREEVKSYFEYFDRLNYNEEVSEIIKFTILNGLETTSEAQYENNHNLQGKNITTEELERMVKNNQEETLKNVKEMVDEKNKQHGTKDKVKLNVLHKK